MFVLMNTVDWNACPSTAPCGRLLGAPFDLTVGWPAMSERLKRRESNGGAEGSRTPDLLNAIQALSQLSYGPTPS